MEDRDLWTKKEVQQIGHSAWHFIRNFASPTPTQHLCACIYVLRLPLSPHRDKTTEIWSTKELILTVPVSHKIEQNTFILQIGQ